MYFEHNEIEETSCEVRKNDNGEYIVYMGQRVYIPKFADREALKQA